MRVVTMGLQRRVPVASAESARIVDGNLGLALKEPRLKDVAARAGVSTATVSRVLHQNGYASADTRKRVEAALRDSGYRLNAVAQGLRRRRTITLGLILQGVLPNPFSAEVAMGAEYAAAEHGFNVVIFNARGEVEREREGVEALLSRRVDGIIFTVSLRSEHVRLALDAGIAVVETQRRLCDDAGAVLVDNYAGAREVMEHLLALGHRTIGYIGEPYMLPDPTTDDHVDQMVTQRFDAYANSLHSAGIEVDETRVVRGTYPRDKVGAATAEIGAEYMRRLLAQAPDVTAVFAASDLLAAGALQTLYERGIRVPDEMSIAGFDDTLAGQLTPPLTTVRQPMFDIGSKAAALAIRLITSESSSAAAAEQCTMSLIVRESTSVPRQDSRATVDDT